MAMLVKYCTSFPFSLDSLIKLWEKFTIDEEEIKEGTPPFCSEKNENWRNEMEKRTV
jgi:hypothetical protein